MEASPDRGDLAGGRFDSFVGLLRTRALTQPDQLAYSFLLDGESEQARLTYAEVDSVARGIAAELQGLQATGKRALLLYAPGLEYVCALLGCLYAGVVSVPVYPPRNERGLPRIKAIANDAEASFALTTRKNLSKMQSALGVLPELHRLEWVSTDCIPRTAAERWRAPAIDRDSMALLQYTSGSTGDPKGVMLSHANLLHNSALMATAFHSSPESVGASWLPPYHDMGLIGGILQPLYVGFPVYLMAPALFLQRPYRWLRAISEARVTISGGPNFAYDLCSQKITAEQRENLDLRCWKVAFNGAEPIRAKTMERFAETFAPCGFRRQSFAPCYYLP
jgi:acyl-CoA synthetase (AMP-forming)/AMP-acid ligase II